MIRWVSVRLRRAMLGVLERMGWRPAMTEPDFDRHHCVQVAQLVAGPRDGECIVLHGLACLVVLDARPEGPGHLFAYGSTAGAVYRCASPRPYFFPKFIDGDTLPVGSCEPALFVYQGEQ